MSAVIVDGKKIAAELEASLRMRVEDLKKRGVQPPLLAVVFVGNHKPSELYVERKGEAAARVGVDFQLMRFGAHARAEEIITRVRQLQDGGSGGSLAQVSGIIVQMPLPQGFDAKKILAAIRLEHDVDVLTGAHFGALALGHAQWLPPTPGAVMEILRRHQVDFTGKHVVIVGRGDLVGKPLSLMLSRDPVTVTVCGKASQPLEQYTRQADIVVTAVGRANLISGDMLKAGAVVIDAGVDFVEGKMVGDVNLRSVMDVASLVTPTPGGVGPVTVAKLLENTVKAAETKVHHAKNRKTSAVS